MFYIGIALEKDVFRVAILKKEKKSVSVESLHTFPYGPDNVKLFYNLPPFHTGKEVVVASGIASVDTFIRKLHLPLKDKRKILEVLPFQLESLVPFSSETPIICTLLRPLSKQMTSVTVIATAKENLLAHLGALKNLDIASDVVSCVPAALMRFGRWKLPQKNKILHLDVRDQVLSCVVCENNEMILSQTLPCDDPLELEKLAVFLKQKGAIDEETPWLLTGDLHLVGEVRKVFPGEGHFHNSDIERLSETCEMTSFALKGIASAISEAQRTTDCTSQPAYQRRNYENGPGEMLEADHGTYAISIGLALDALEGDENSVQFCQKEFTPDHTLLRRKKKILSYLTFALSAALLMFAGGKIMLNKQQNILTHRLQNYLSPSLAGGSLTSPEDIENKLSVWEASLKGKKNTFAFLNAVPRVSDVLAWLSSHPSFTTDDGRQKEGIEIKSLHYHLTKYPKIGETSSPYMAQFELEFSSQIPRVARDFHEALLKGDQIVNAKKDVKWQTQNQTYQTSFELSKGVSQ